jgi:hypothetical protein
MSDWGQGAKNNEIGWGQGAINNEIGWGAIHELSYSGDTDIVGSAAADPAFKMTIDTTQAGSASDTFVLPLASGSVYDFDIDWGDGSSETITTSTNVTHVYDTAGEYQIAITGDFPRIFFNNTGDRLKLMSIDNFGDIVWGSTLEGAWWGCNNMVINASDVGNFGGVTSFFRTWNACSSLTSFPLIDTSSGTTFQSAWSNCSSLTSFPLIDTSSGTNFFFCWNACSSLTSFPLIDTSSGTNFSFAWQSCSSLTSFPLIDTSSGTNFSFAWNGCNSLTSFPLIDTSSGTTFTSAWNGCSSLTSFPLIDTSSGTTFTSAWQSCSSLTSFPLLDTSSGTTFQDAWRICSSLTSFPANAFDTNIATNYTTAFLTTALLTQSIDDILVSLDTSGVINGSFTQSGGQAPSATGEAAIDSLVGKGWTITVTGGYTP